MAKDKSSKPKDDVIDAEDVSLKDLGKEDLSDPEDVQSEDFAHAEDGASERVEENSDIETDTSAPVDAAPTPPAEQISEPARQSIFMPLLFGGIIAGAIGFGAGTYLNGQGSQDLAAQIAALDEKITGLGDQVSSTPVVDLAPIEQTTTNLSESLENLSAEVSSSVTSLSERLDIVERQPSGDGTLQEAAVAAYERDIQELRDQLAGQQADMEAMLNATSERLQATQQEALAIEEQTVAAAKAATARSALARIQSALDSGAPYGAILAELEAVSDTALPDALVAVRDGAPTLSSLVADFPEAARAALATSRAEGASGEDSTGFSAFLKNQFSVRSVEPKEGSSVDAILSRAQAALAEGRLNDTLLEVASLPEVARADLSVWTAQAEMRASAVDAASTLFSSFNTN